MKNIVSLSMMLMLLAACDSQIRVPGATVKGENFEIDIDGDHHRGDSRHCPPGHAKKDWC